MGRESNGIEGAKRPFGRERSEPSCPGPGSVERSAAERGPNSSFNYNATFLESVLLNEGSYILMPNFVSIFLKDIVIRSSTCF